MKRAQGRRPCAARPARADVMHLAGTCHTHPSTLLPRQMRAQTARTCESYHVCPGGERAQGAAAAHGFGGGVMQVRGRLSNHELSSRLPSHLRARTREEPIASRLPSCLWSCVVYEPCSRLL